LQVFTALKRRSNAKRRCNVNPGSDDNGSSNGNNCCSNHPWACGGSTPDDLVVDLVDESDFAGIPACSDPGNFLGWYCGGGGGQFNSSINTVGPDGECAGNVCVFSGAGVPFTYNASYDVRIYENLMIVTLYENYWIPGRAIPLMENATFGGSVLISQLRNGQQMETSLGNFAAGSIAYPNRLTNRVTTINFWGGRKYFPTQLVIRLTWGAEQTGAKTVYYPLPYVP